MVEFYLSICHIPRNNCFDLTCNGLKLGTSKQSLSLTPSQQLQQRVALQLVKFVQILASSLSRLAPEIALVDQIGRVALTSRLSPLQHLIKYQCHDILLKYSSNQNHTYTKPMKSKELIAISKLATYQNRAKTSRWQFSKISLTKETKRIFIRNTPMKFKTRLLSWRNMEMRVSQTLKRKFNVVASYKDLENLSNN